MSGRRGRLCFAPERGHFFTEFLVGEEQFTDECLKAFVLRLQYF